MSPEDSQRLEAFKDGITAALLRAAERVREIARQTDTAVVYEQNGKLVREYPAREAKPKEP
jgi:hypothetical protein